MLGRCRRDVLLVDAGTPRNRASRAIHAFLSRDGIAPPAFAAAAHEELARYDGVELWHGEVVEAQRAAGGFRVRLADGREARSRKLLLATGLYDALPPIEGIEAYFGRSVFPCPYCDGWEVRDAPIAVYGRGQRAVEMARAMTAWTRDIVVCTNGPARVSPEDRRALKANGISVREERIAALEGEDGRLHAVRFAGGERLPRRALFFDTPTRQQSLLAQQLGCSFKKDGGVRCGRYEATDVPGVYVAGNTIKDVNLAIVAAAEGAKAAFGINKALTREDFERSGPEPERQARGEGIHRAPHGRRYPD